MVDEVNVGRPRVRPGLRRFLFWVGPVLLAIAAWQTWDAIETGRVERAIARAFPEGVNPPHMSWEQDNAARYYVAASSAVMWPSDSRVQSAGVTWEVREALARGESPTVAGIDDAFALVVRNQLSLDLIERARGLPFGTFRPGTEFNYRFGGLMQVAQLAAFKTLDALRHGDGATAATSLASRVRLLRAFEAERRLFGAAAIATELRGIAIDTALLLRRTRQPDVVLDELARALDDEAVSEVDRFIAGESAARFDALRVMVDGRTGSVASLLVRPAVRHHIAGMMQVTGDARQAARLPWPDAITAMNAVPEHRSVLPEIPRFVAPWRLQSAFRELVKRVGISTAAARCARLVIAIERYRTTRGVLPQRLDDLGWSGPTEALIDPFTGKPLQYVTTSDGYALYSVGPDLTDENGKVFPQRVNGRPSGTGPTPDIGVVLSVKALQSN